MPATIKKKSHIDAPEQAVMVDIGDASGIAEDGDCFWAAFEKLLLDIEGDRDAIRAHSDMLIKAATSGGYHPCIEMMALLIPEYLWHWPAYDEQILRREKEKHLDYLSKLRDEPFEKLLERMKLSELREIAQGRVKAKSKKDLIGALQMNIPEQELQTICTTIRQRIIADAGSFKPKYEDRCFMFIRRLSMLAYGLRSKAHMRRTSTAICMKAEFYIGDPFSTPQECHARCGLLVPLDDPVVDKLCPCDRLECGCVWFPHTVS